VPQTTPICTFCTASRIFVMSVVRNFKFGQLVNGSKSQPADDKSSLKGACSGSCFHILEFYIPCNISAMANDRDFKFCTRVGHAKS